MCREVRASALSLLDSLVEEDLDAPSAKMPAGFEDNVADHWYMHRGHLANARRAAGVVRMWV